MGSGDSSIIPTMVNLQTKGLLGFLQYIFYVVGQNSPYELRDFLNILITATQTPDFINNTCIKTQPGPNGQTVFNRLLGCTHEKIYSAFNDIISVFFRKIKPILRNRRLVLAFDTTYEPFYGDANSNWYWIDDYKPVRGCTGCFVFITVSVAVGEKRFILGSLPVPRGYNKADYVEKLIKLARKYVVIEACLFDRGFNSYELIHRLKKLRVGYQIFWKKDKKRETWLTKELKKLKPRQMKEYIKEDGYFHKNKTKYYVRTRFIIIKQYRYKEDKEAYDWVFATNMKMKSQMWYIRRYKCRWAIETAFRIIGDVRIKTTATDEVKRFFLFMFCCLLYNLWKFSNLFLEIKATFQTFIFVFFDIVSKDVKRSKEPPDNIKELRAMIRTEFF